MGTTKGLSYMLVFLNLTGDILKLIYFFVKVPNTYIYSPNPSSLYSVESSRSALTHLLLVK